MNHPQSFRAATAFTMAILATAIATAEPVDLIPESQLGFRGHVRVKELVWRAESPWLGKPGPVCRVTAPEIPYAPLIALAEQAGMSRTQDTDDQLTFTKEGDLYKRLRIHRRTGRVLFGLENTHKVVRDENMDAVVKGMPEDSVLVAKALEWLAKLGIHRKGFVERGDGPGGMDTYIGGVTRTGWSTKEQRRVSYAVNRTVSFSRKIGGLPANWHGMGGRISFTFIDGGALAEIEFCFRGFEEMGQYEVLERAEIERAVLDGFCWTRDPIEAERAVVFRIQLEAYHGKDTHPQRHFPLIWLVGLHPEDDPEDRVVVSIPALRQHRDRYPLPRSGTHDD